MSKLSRSLSAAMGFFDLNIPYGDSVSNKANRIKLATKAMELGYGGVAYNRTMRGVMSDRDRCSIPLLSLSSLLRVAPSLSSSVSFHRDLLGVPRSSPFRQYTRLTVSADSVSRAQALNSGNPVLKSYDLVAVKPLNQTVFDYACEKSEVDIISLDFSEKLPFRLKLPMVKAAIGRGVYFEIMYSSLVADIQVRRQMISNAKLLVDWARGKNLIVSSAAASVNEIRGPYDVANLLSLLGVPMERAKASISRNCRTLIANALRKKQFYKETIRVEPIQSMEKQDGAELWSLDWDKWDPISSGTGDLCLENVEKSLLTSKEVSKTVKAIDFESVIETMPSCGFQVKNLMPETEVASQTTKDCVNLLGSSAFVDLSVETKVTSSNSETSSCDISLELKSSNFEVSEEPLLVMGTVDAKEDPVQAYVTTEGDSLVEPSVPRETAGTEDDRVRDDSASDELMSLNESGMPAVLDKTNLVGLESGKPFLAGDDLDVLLHCESSSSLMDTMVRDIDLHRELNDNNLTNCQINEECRYHESPLQLDKESDREDGLSFKTDGNFKNSKESSEKDRSALRMDARSPSDVSLISGDVPSHVKAAWDDQTDSSLNADRLRLSAVPCNLMELMSTTALVDNDLSSDQLIITTDASSMSDKLPLEAGLGNQKQGVEDPEPSDFIPSPSILGSARARRPLRAVPFPFKSQLSLLISKKQRRRHRRRI